MPVAREAVLPAEKVLLTTKEWHKAEDQKLAKNKNSVQVVWEVDDVFGKAPFRENEQAAWNDICANVMRQPRAIRDGGACVPLSKVIAKFMPSPLRSDAFETDVWRSIHELEAALRLEGKKGATLGRTRLKISRDGEHKTVADLLKGEPSKGFQLLIDRGLTKRTFEAVALDHPHLFNEQQLKTAAKRLEDARRSAG